VTADGKPFALGDTVWMPGLPPGEWTPDAAPYLVTLQDTQGCVHTAWSLGSIGALCCYSTSEAARAVYLRQRAGDMAVEGRVVWSTNATAPHVRIVEGDTQGADILIVVPPKPKREG